MHFPAVSFAQNLLPATTIADPLAISPAHSRALNLQPALPRSGPLPIGFQSEYLLGAKIATT